MKNSYLIIVLCFLAFSCKEETTVNKSNEAVTTAKKEEDLKTKEVPEKKASNDVLGMFVGNFKASKYDYDKKPSYHNKINITISSISESKVVGHSVVAGNSRPFEGTYNSETNTYEVKEPGDDKYDGKFLFWYDIDRELLIGTWNSYDTKLAVPERSFELKRNTFSYDPERQLIPYSENDEESNEEDYPFTSLSDDQMAAENGEFETVSWDAIKTNASKKLLVKEDVENLYKADLEIIRNTIYARHGYSFKNRKMRYFFDQYVDWYIPMSTDVRNQLTEVEVKNIELIKRYEQHAERYYDYFGR